MQCCLIAILVCDEGRGGGVDVVIRCVPVEVYTDMVHVHIRGTCIVATQAFYGSEDSPNNDGMM